MSQMQLSSKRMAIDKANASLIVIVAISAFVVVFSLVAAKALLDQRAYQSKVISKKELARDTLQENIAAVDTLNTAYQEFANAEVNVLGGNPDGKGDRDGENPRIILDALPSKYDFPALTTSIEKLLSENKFKLSNITGVDDEVAQSENTYSESPTPVEIPFSIEAEVPGSGAKSMVELFERSIRPIHIQKMELSEQNGQLLMTLTGKTFYQPGKNLNVRSEVVR
jgi:hypothetical protein